MAAQPTGPVTDPALSDGPHVRVRQALAFLLVGGGVALVALDGGSYDVVVRQRLALVAWWLVALAAIAGLVPRSAPGAAGRVVLGALAAMGLWTAASFGWTSSDEKTLVEVARVAAHLAIVVLVAGALGRHTWWAAVGGATAAAVAVLVVALGSRLAPGTFGEDVVAEAFGSRRLSVPFGYWNAVGAWAGMTSALCLGWSAHARTLAVRALALAVLPLAVLTSYLTYSRASLGGTVLGLLVVLALSRHRWTALIHAAAGIGAGLGVIAIVRSEPAIATGEGTAGAGTVLLTLLVAATVVGGVGAATGVAGSDRWRMPLRAARRAALAGGVLTATAVVVLAVLFGGRAWDSFTTTANVQAQDPAARLTNLQGTRSAVWAAGWRGFKAEPVTGTGAGTYEWSWNQRGTTSEFIRDGHSLYLEALTELGVIGLVLVLVLVGGFAWVFAAAVRRVTRPLERGVIAGAGGACAAFCFGAGVDWLWESTGVAALALVLVACVMTVSARPVRWSRRGRLAMAVAAVLLLAVQLPGMVSTSEVRRSQDAVAAGDLAAAREHAQTALEAQPWAASPLVQRGLVAERAGDLAQAIADLSLAERREPEDWRVPLLLARVRARDNDTAGALAAYRRARALRPRAQFFERPSASP